MCCTLLLLLWWLPDLMKASFGFVVFFCKYWNVSKPPDDCIWDGFVWMKATMSAAVAGWTTIVFDCLQMKGKQEVEEEGDGEKGTRSWRWRELAEKEGDQWEGWGWWKRRVIVEKDGDDAKWKCGKWRWKRKLVERDMWMMSWKIVEDEEEEAYQEDDAEQRWWRASCKSESKCTHLLSLLWDVPVFYCLPIWWLFVQFSVSVSN